MQLTGNTNSAVWGAFFEYIYLFVYTMQAILLWDANKFIKKHTLTYITKLS